MSKKVLFYINHIGNSLTGRLAVNLAEGFIKKDNQVVLLTDLEQHEEYEISDAIKRVNSTVALSSDSEITISDKAKLKMIQLRLKEVLTEEKPDMIFTFGVPAARRVLQISHRVPIVLIDRNDVQNIQKNEMQKKRLQSEREKKQLFSTYQKVSKVVLQTQEAYEFMPEALQKKCVVLPGLISEKYLGVQTGSERNTSARKAIVSVGRFQESCGRYLLVRAFERLLEDYPDYTLELYGAKDINNSYHQIMEHIRAHGLQDKVIICDTEKNLKDKMKDATMVVLPSGRPGVSVTMMEAMALSVPVLASDNPDGAARSIIDDGYTGLLFDRGDEDELYIAMKKYLDYPAEANRIALEAGKIVEEYHPEKVLDMWTQLLEN